MVCFSLADSDYLKATEDPTEQLDHNMRIWDHYYYDYNKMLDLLTTRWQYYSGYFSRASFNGCHAGLHAMHH